MRDEAGGVDISPLIDMVFILLVFFVVATSFIEEKGVEAKTSEPIVCLMGLDEPLKITIADTGEVFFAERSVSLDVLRTMLSAASQMTSGGFILEVEEGVATELMVSVIDSVSGAGIDGLTLRQI